MSSRRVRVPVKVNPEVQYAGLRPTPANLRPNTPNGKPARRYSTEETKQHLQVVEAMIVDGYSLTTIIKQMRARFQAGESRSKQLYARIQEQWNRDFDQDRKSYKQAQVKRILRMIREASGEQRPDGTWVRPPKHAALARHETILAHLVGTFEPVKVDVNVEVRESLAIVVSRLDTEQTEEYLAEARKRHQLANQAEIAMGEQPSGPMGLKLLGGKGG